MNLQNKTAINTIPCLYSHKLENSAPPFLHYLASSKPYFFYPICLCLTDRQIAIAGDSLSSLNLSLPSPLLDSSSIKLARISLIFVVPLIYVDQFTQVLSISRCFCLCTYIFMWIYGYFIFFTMPHYVVVGTSFGDFKYLVLLGTNYFVIEIFQIFFWFGQNLSISLWLREVRILRLCVI